MDCPYPGRGQKTVWQLTTLCKSGFFMAGKVDLVVFGDVRFFEAVRL